jgi:hypothetical protein
MGTQHLSNGIAFFIHGKSPNWDDIDSLIKHGRTTKGINGIKKKLGKSILQYSINGEFIQEYICVADASRFLGLPKHGYVSIISCANNKKNQVTAYGFKWKWKQ